MSNQRNLKSSRIFDPLVSLLSHIYQIEDRRPLDSRGTDQEDARHTQPIAKEIPHYQFA